jgi:alpha-glucosidase
VAASSWWRDAAIYQIYPRSFADGNGDGIGDLAGIRARLPYLAELGINAIWFSPWYPSPMADGGYDVADYRDIDPVFGRLDEAELLIQEAHALGLRMIIDIVPNHCSDRHPWFTAALAAEPGSPQRARFHFRPGRGESGELPPNDWHSHFGGPAWTRTVGPDGRPGQWYLHMFAPEQPDFNWDNPQVVAEFEDVLRFWLDRGVDGFRIDVADHLAKEDGLPEVAGRAGFFPWRDQDAVHEIFRGWRRIADAYPGERIFVGELWLDDRERFADYLRPDELHTGFNFPFLQSHWEAGALRQVIDETLSVHATVDAPPTWVLSNHDTTRHVTRYGRQNTGHDNSARGEGAQTDLALGTRRARAAALLTLALPGCVYVYQGEELGLWEVEDLPEHLLQDPIWIRSGHTVRGRDGCRVPLPWSGHTLPFGFSDPDALPWLPQPLAWRELTAQAQDRDPDSMLNLYRRALRLRRAEAALGEGTLAWLDATVGVLAFRREPSFACVINIGGDAVPLPPHELVLLASGPIQGELLPPDTAVWLRTIA